MWADSERCRSHRFDPSDTPCIWSIHFVYEDHDCGRGRLLVHVCVDNHALHGGVQRCVHLDASAIIILMEHTGLGPERAWFARTALLGAALRPVFPGPLASYRLAAAE